MTKRKSSKSLLNSRRFNMNVIVAVCFILGCISFARGAEVEDRFERELANLPDNLSMYNPMMELIPLTKNRNPDQKYYGHVTFFYYTQKYAGLGREIRINEPVELSNAGFDVNKPTYFVTHGWLSTNSTPDCILIRNAYLKNTDSNIIVVDWSKYSFTMNYVDAVSQVRAAGKKVARMIKYLYTQGLNADYITLVGFSLGAHVMGIAGYNVKPKVKQIIGLDPALPMFRFAGVGEALSSEDAQNVQIIHTNAGGLGYLCPNGHSNFFPNGGAMQDGCCDGISKGSLTRKMFAVGVCAACSHWRAFQYFAESITKTFDGTRCASFVFFRKNTCSLRTPHTESMGGLSPHKVKPGTYYLWTGSRFPFSVSFPRPTSLFVDFSPFATDLFCAASSFSNSLRNLWAG